MGRDSLLLGWLNSLFMFIKLKTLRVDTSHEDEDAVLECV